MSNVNGKTIDAIDQIKEVGHLKSNTAPLAKYSHAMDTATIAHCITNDTQNHTEDGQYTEPNANDALGNEPLFSMVSYDGYKFEKQLASLYDIKISINRPYYPINIANALQTLLWEWKISKDGGTTYITVGSISLIGNIDQDLDFDIKEIRFPMNDLTGSLRVKLNITGSTASEAVFTQAPTTIPEWTVEVLHNTSGV